VWGACRAYRRQCIDEVRPLEQREGWDEIDSIKAQLRGWKVGTLFDLTFRHHRGEGSRDGERRRWIGQGTTAHYMGYRFSYLLVRSLFRARREPLAVGMLAGYAGAALRRVPQCDDADVLRFIRREQAIRKLRLRALEALGRST
jgi:hypothetical protein